jgi:hypothetical protein
MTVAVEVQWRCSRGAFHSHTGLLTRMTSELQRQCSDITDRLAPPTASSTVAVSLPGYLGIPMGWRSMCSACSMRQRSALPATGHPQLRHLPFRSPHYLS